MGDRFSAWRDAVVAAWKELDSRARVLLALKSLALTAFVVLTNVGPGARTLTGYAVYFAFWALSLASLVHVAFFGSRGARAVWSALVFASALVGAGYRLIFDENLSLVALDQLMRLIGFIDTVLQFYGKKLAPTVVVCAIGAVALNLGPVAARARSIRSRRARLTGLGIQLAPVAAMSFALFARNGEGIGGAATQHTSLAFLAALAVDRVAEGTAPPRQTKIPYEAAKERTLDNVIVVMDESIRGDLLDVNLPGGAVTGLRDRPDVVNFGVMSSIANCSLESNVSVRYGVGREHYLRQLKTNASIFTWAKHAGYAPYYLDAQRTGGNLQNGMDEAEKAELAGFVQLPPDLPIHQRDVEIAKALRKLLDEETGKPKFVFVNKMGAHYPYEGKYPEDAATWTPTMNSDFFGNEAEPGCKCHCGDGCRVMQKYVEAKLDADFRRRFKNSYLNAVTWNTQRFFETLLTGFDTSRTLIVYMGDHGQDLREDGRRGLNTHCTSSGRAHPDEGKVPLVVITGQDAIARELRAAAETNRDRTSMFGVFPSVLHWLGYARADVGKLDVDPPIEAPVTNEHNQEFLSRYFVRFGAKPQWTSITKPYQAAR